jgi:hypothetical protein
MRSLPLHKASSNNSQDLSLASLESKQLKEPEEIFRSCIHCTASESRFSHCRQDN